MILQALNAYYERLRDDPDVDVVEQGYSLQKISFRVVLQADGALVQIEDARKVIGSRAVSTPTVVLGEAKPPGQGINPCFLWDNASYSLGYVPADQGDAKAKRAAKAFEAFRERHLGVRDEIGSEEYDAVCEFLRAWKPADAEANGMSPDLAVGFGTFRIQGNTHDVHQDPAVDAWWRSSLGSNSADEAPTMQCLVTGKPDRIAKIHEPKIKGVAGAQSSGAALASYNFGAAESYGKQQNYNAPISQEAAFRYSVALNQLLDRDRGRRFSVGDASVVFWTERPSAGEAVFGFVMDPGDKAEDEVLLDELRSAFRTIDGGGFPSSWGDPSVPFYVLGVSPNAARLSVRFWHVSSLAELLNATRRHFTDIAIVRGPQDPEFPSVWRLARETAREAKDVSPLLGGALLRSVLQGVPYPVSFLTALVRRLRADGNFNGIRCGAIKACLNRDFRAGFSSPLSMELAVSLDPDRPEEAYQLGRLFAALERCQQDALGRDLNATIKDRYFGAASSTPATVFPRLIRMNQHHVSKIENEGRRINIEKLLGQICQRIDGFPSHLDLKRQGLFAIGYYHQRQDFFTPRATAEAAQAKETE